MAVEQFYLQNSELRYGWAIPEIRVCKPEWWLAGTVDLVCSYQGVPSILDFKTSKEIKYVGYKNMYAPFNKLPDSNFWHYSTQLSLYARILRDRFGYDAQLLGIVHLFPGGYEVHRVLRLPDEWLDKAVKKYAKKRGTPGDFRELSADGWLWNI